MRYHLLLSSFVTSSLTHTMTWTKLVHLYAKSRMNLRITNQAKSATFSDVTIPQHLGSVSCLDVVDVRMCIHHMSMYPYRAVH